MPECRLSLAVFMMVDIYFYKFLNKNTPGILSKYVPRTLSAMKKYEFGFEFEFTRERERELFNVCITK